LSTLRLISDYKHQDNYRLSFNQLASETFGINFEPWYQAGGWGDRYICYSFADGEKIVANASINKMDLLWEGKSIRALQIGTVMTHPDYRGRGLGASLMNSILTEHEKAYDLIYLFGDASALGFYRKLGFAEITESQYSLKASGLAGAGIGLRKLDITNSSDMALIRRLISMCVPVSSTLAAVNHQYLLLFYCLLGFSAHLYYSAEQDSLVIYRIKEHTLHLYDVISTQQISLAKLLEQIVGPEVSHVRFHFAPDLPGHDILVEPLQTDDGLFVRPAPNWVTKPFTFPYTSRA